MSERIKFIKTSYENEIEEGKGVIAIKVDDYLYLLAALAAKEAELQAEREKVKYYHDKNQEKCAEIDTLRQELAALRGSLAARRSYSFFAG